MVHDGWQMILYHPIHTLLHSALQSLYLDKTSWLMQPKEQDGPRCAHSVHANVSPRQRSPDLGFPPTSPVPFQGWKRLETAARQGCWITFNRFGWHPALPTQKKKTCPWLSNLFNAVIEPVGFHFWIVDRQAILVSIRWCYPPHAFVIPLPKMASRRPMSSFDKKVQRTTVIGANIEPFLTFFNGNSTCTQKIALSYRPGVKVSSFPCHSLDRNSPSVTL